MNHTMGKDPHRSGTSSVVWWKEGIRQFDKGLGGKRDGMRAGGVKWHNLRILDDLLLGHGVVWHDMVQQIQLNYVHIRTLYVYTNKHTHKSLRL